MPNFFFKSYSPNRHTDTQEHCSPSYTGGKTSNFSVLEPVEKKQVEIDPDALLDKVPPILAMEKPYQLNIELDSFTLAWQPAIYPSGAKQVPIK